MADSVDVAVVGAGFSGLAAIKACLEENLSVVCFEKTNNIGGTWKYREDGISCMRSTTSNLSKESYCFSDFPFPAETPNFLLNSEFQAYLVSYAANFGLDDKIHLQHEVTSIQAGPQFQQLGNWKITVRNQKTGNDVTVIASKVMVCIGVFTKPNLNSFEGLSEFKGEIIHSSDYKTPNGYENKNILVLGQGNSAYDVAVELGRTAKQLYCLIKPGMLILSRIASNGLPFDIVAFTRFNLMKWSVYGRMAKIDEDLRKMSGLVYDPELYGLPLTGYKFDNHILSINDEMPFCILSGRIKMKPPITKFTATGVIFSNDPVEHPIDVVVLGTGYDIPDLSYIDILTASDFRYGLYKNVFPHTLDHPTMAFISLCRYDGSGTMLAELQSRWVARVFASKCQLPTKDEMKRNIEATTDIGTETKFPVLLPLPYIDDIAGFIGVKPSFFRLLFADPLLFKAWLFGPFTSYQYRLKGPHSWPEARETILTVPSRIRAGFGIPMNFDSKNRRCVVKFIVIGSVCAAVVCAFRKFNSSRFLLIGCNVSAFFNSFR